MIFLVIHWTKYLVVWRKTSGNTSNLCNHFKTHDKSISQTDWRKFFNTNIVHNNTNDIELIKLRFRYSDRYVGWNKTHVWNNHSLWSRVTYELRFMIKNKMHTRSSYNGNVLNYCWHSYSPFVITVI